VSAVRPAPSPSTALALPPLLSGLDMATAPAGADVEVAPAAAGAEVSDDAWARDFGATEVGDAPQAVAVSGTTVYVGGSFTGVMAGMPQGTYNRVARWDGVAWDRLGEGVDGTVTSLTVAGTDLYVGGEFTTAGGQVAAEHLARWDGQAWSSVGSVQYVDQPYSVAVRALACDETHLYVGGVFDHIGEVAASSLARMELASGRWEAVGAGVTYLGSPGQVHALLVADGRLYVGGAFDTAGTHTTCSLASVDIGTGEWTAYGTGIRNGDFAGIVDALAFDPARGAVFVGGSFTAADTVTASGVARLAGSTLGSTGRFTRYGDPGTASVKALAVAGPLLFAGGEFTTAGNAATTSWAAFDGTAWSVPAPFDNTVLALAAVGDDVVVLGDFAFSGPLRVTHGAIWTGSSWQSFGEGLSYDPFADGNVYALSADGEDVYAGGYFDQAGALPVGSVARWTADGWNPVGGGVRRADTLGTVYAMARLGTDLYVAGSFTTAGAGAAGNIARWDGAGWQPLASGLNGTAYALAVLGGRLFAGGEFSNAGMTGASGVAAWDPATQAWSMVGNAPLYDEPVYALAAVHDRYLVIGGEFDALRAGGVDLVRGLHGMALFDTQEQVDPAVPLSGYLAMAGVKRAGGTGRVRALQVLGEELYVGGDFDTAGVLEWTKEPDPGFAAQNLAVWRFGSEGLPWATTGGTDQPVQALATADGRRLVVGGYFRAAGPVAAGGVAELDPAAGAWSTYGSGIGGGLRGVTHVEAVALDADGAVWAAGTFNTAGGKASCSIARCSTAAETTA
jgi:trimeric autotransporter adhesin